MRFSTISLLALPALAAAQQSPLDQAYAMFDKIKSFIPNPNKAHTPHAAAAKAGGKTLNILTLNDWESTIRGVVKPGSTTPEEWWVLLTGQNKTCFGQCGKIETAFNETAALWSLDPTAPHLAYLDCDNQPVLCNAWSGGPPGLWIFDVLPKPAPVTVRTRRLNTTTTDVSTFQELRSSQSYKKLVPYEGVFHPFDGFFAQNGLAVPLGYFFWAFAVIPSWMFMIGISFLSRSIMSSRMPPPARGPPRAAPGTAPAAARARVGAPPGDGRS